MAHAEIDAEVQRLQGLLSGTSEPDPVERAILEALSSSDVQSLLGPIIDEGASIVGVTMDAAGSMEGVAQFTFNTVWKSTTASRITPPARVVALVQISPPRLLKAIKLTGGEAESAKHFVQPSGPVPAALKELDIPAPQDVLDFNRAMNISVDRWLKATGLADKLPALASNSLTATRQPSTTGTKCSTMLCLEQSSDDWDTAD